MEEEKNEPQFSPWFAVKTHRMGLPLHGSPLVFLLPKFLRRVRMRRPHPLERGGATAFGFRASALAGAVDDPAHIPQERGGAPFGDIGCG
jgi:hypothetical protein